MQKPLSFSLDSTVNEILSRRLEARRKERKTRTMKDVRERERNMGQVCIYCGHRRPLTEFDVRNICRLCVSEAKKETPRAK